MKFLIPLIALSLLFGCETEPDDYASTEADPARTDEIELREPAPRVVVKASPEVAGLVDYLGERFEDMHEGGAVVIEKGDVSSIGDAEVLASLGPITVKDMNAEKIAVDPKTQKTVYLYTKKSPEIFTKRFVEYSASPTGQRAVETHEYQAVDEAAEATAGEPLGK